MRFGKFSLAAIAAASLVCAPVMAKEVERQAYTENITVAQAPVKTVAIAAVLAASVCLIEQVDDRIAADDMLVIPIQRVAYMPHDVHLAVLRTGPVGITSLQATSLVDLSTKSRFDNFADRYRALDTT